MGENAPNGCDQPIEFDRLGVELVAPRRERLFAFTGEREKALAAGCNEFDTKPIEFDRLVATVRRILAHRK